VSSSKAILIAQIDRNNVKDLLLNEYAIHVRKSNIVSTTSIVCKVDSCKCSAIGCIN
jgi:hypothetical protein